MSDSGTCCGGGCEKGAGNPATGVQNPWVIDAIESSGERVTLKMVESRAWSEEFDRMFELQEKFNAYMAFILDGEMQTDFPTLVGRPIGVLLECKDYPPPAVVDFLQKVREQMLLMDIDLEVDVRGGPSSDEAPPEGQSLRSVQSGCGCGPEGCGTVGGQ